MKPAFDLICPAHALYPIQRNAEPAQKQELTGMLLHIHPWTDKTHIHRPSGGHSSGILLTWCQGLKSVGSASKRQAPCRACSIYDALPPLPPAYFTGSLNSSVKTPFVKFIHCSISLTPKMSFSTGGTGAATWNEVGPRKRELTRLGLLRRKRQQLPLLPLLLEPHHHAAFKTPSLTIVQHYQSTFLCS